MAKSPQRKQKALTPRQARFVEAYLLSPVAKAAAASAGFKHPEQQGYQLLHLPEYAHVQAAIAAAQGTRAERVGLELDEVLRVLKRILHADPRKAFDENSRMLPIREIPDDVALTISGIDNEELFGPDLDGNHVQLGNVRKLKFWSKDKSIELALKHLGALTEKHEHSFGDMTDEQLEARLKAIVAKTTGVKSRG